MRQKWPKPWQVSRMHATKMTQTMASCLDACDKNASNHCEFCGCAPPPARSLTTPCALTIHQVRSLCAHCALTNHQMRSLRAHCNNCRARVKLGAVFGMFAACIHKTRHDLCHFCRMRQKDLPWFGSLLSHASAKLAMVWGTFGACIHETHRLFEIAWRVRFFLNFNHGVSLNPKP